MSKKRITAFIGRNYINTMNATEMTSGNFAAGMNGRIVSIADVSCNQENLGTSTPAVVNEDYNLSFVLGTGDVIRLDNTTSVQPEINATGAGALICSLNIREGGAWAMVLRNKTGSGLTINAMLMLTIELD